MVVGRTLVVLAATLLFGSCASIAGKQTDLYDQLTEQDVILASDNLQRSLEFLEDGETRRWTNTSNGHQGAITPTETYLSAGGAFCRNYREDLQLGDRAEQFHHTACRDDQAGWTWI